MNVQEVAGSATQNSYTKRSSYVDKEQFLKILVAQLKYQNPLQPLKPEEFLGQLSQLTQVEQLQNIYSSVESMKEILNHSSSLNFSSLLGKKVGTESQFMTKGDELYITPSEDYDTVTVVLQDLSTGERRETIIQKGQPLVYKYEGENPVFVSVFGTKGRKTIICQTEVYRVVSRIDVDSEGKIKVVFEDGQSIYVENVKKVKQ
ncbi:MAG: hypothetical protein N2513_01760 [Deltaproteobacteria bacterium]|nr:hypothetical protein [Deltaproteobacteria bacterium]